ncbi:DNA glycosylase AlkZ-like family protein [Streptococcus merionis]|uniref:DNA glycosylase AlkZ-like family protein n=1 Tax=Streptococcus merionis TaxID=400065 RepID=UPI0035135D2E
MKIVSQTDILAQRFYNQGFVNPYEDVESLLMAALGIQSQYINHGLFNLSTRLLLRKNDKVMKSIKSAILAWGQRQTYHFYNKATWLKIASYLSEERIWVEKYFEEEGLDLDSALVELQDMLVHPQTRSQLAQAYGDRWAQLFTWSALFLQASRTGQLYQQLLAHDRLVIWENQILQKPAEVSKDLLESYFAFYGPATLADAAHFFGIKQDQIDKENLAGLYQLTDHNKVYYVTDWQENITIPEVLVLGKFDPLLVAYRHKSVLIPAEVQPLVWKKGGQISALVLIKGKLRATWTMAHQNQGIRFVVTSPKPLALKHQATVRRRFKDYARWLDKAVSQVLFEVVK